MLSGSSKIERKDIIDVVEGKRTYSTFALIDALRARDTEKTFQIYSVLKETEEPYSLLGALNWQYGQFMGQTIHLPTETIIRRYLRCFIRPMLR